MPIFVRKTSKYRYPFGSVQRGPTAAQEQRGTSGTRRRLNNQRRVCYTPSRLHPSRKGFDSGQIKIPPRYPSLRPLKFRMNTTRHSHVGAQVERVSRPLSPSQYPPRCHGMIIFWGQMKALICRRDLLVGDLICREWVRGYWRAAVSGKTDWRGRSLHQDPRMAGVQSPRNSR
jgi:hypothetical protein